MPTAVRSRDELIESHLGLARHLAARYRDRGEPLDDLVQVAMMGLVKAAQRFDGERGVSFSTYATATISGELKRHFRDHRWGVRVARPLQDLFLEVRSTVEELTHKLCRSPSVAEVAAEVGVTEEQVVEAMEVGWSFSPGSLDATGFGDDDEPIANRLGEDDGGFAQVDEGEWVGRLVGRLPAREREIVRLRFVHQLTQSQIAKRVGLSQMQVSRVLNRSLGQLRAWAADDAGPDAGQVAPGRSDAAAAVPAMAG